MTEHLPEPEYEPPRRALAPRPERSGWRKARRALWIGAAGLFGFLLLALIAGVIWLHTGGGREELGRFVANEAKNAIRGDLRVQAIQVGGFLHLCADGVELRDPDGHKVLSADRVCVKLQPLALKAHRVILTEVELARPWIEIAKAEGSTETTLQRALAPKNPSPREESGGPFQWVIDVRALSLRGGAVAVRPQLGEPATFALDDLNVSQTRVRYSSDAASAALQLAAQLAAPGKLPVALALDATVAGALATGAVEVKSLHLALGDSGLSLSGSWDVARRAGAVKVRDLRVFPKDLEALMPAESGPGPLAGAVRGEADLQSDGKSAQADLRIEGGGGRLQAKVTSTLEKTPLWDLQLSVEKLDPGALSPAAPRGELSARASIHGKGTPRFDSHGVRGELQGAVHLGPARLDRVGPVTADLTASLQGRSGIVKAFTATALGLEVKAHGAAAYDEISLDLDVNAPDLSHVARAIGALERKRPPPLAGSLRLTAHATGAPTRPDAKVRLRAPSFRFGPTVAAQGLAIDGDLHGLLARPSGSLRLVAQRLSAGAVDLGTPRVDMVLQWPLAHLRIDAGVKGGSVQLAGDATIDDDKDGLVLSNFVVAWPGNLLHLARDADIHFRDQVVVEPLELIGDHGSLRFSAQISPPPGRVDAALVLTRFELDRLPQFALPKDLALRGILDLNAVVQGPRAAPDLDLRADLRAAGARPAGDLQFDGHTHAHVHGGRLQTDGWVASPGIVRAEWQGQMPLQQLATQPASAPVQLDARLLQVDLGRLAAAAKLGPLQQQQLQGLVEAHVVASGTLGAPRATVAIDARQIGTVKLQQIDARAGLVLDKGKAVLDGNVSLGGEPALSLTAQAPFDASRALREPAYLRAALERPITAQVAVSQLDLARLARSGVLPPDSSGRLSLTARLSGTPAQPQLQVIGAGESISVGKLRGLAFQGDLGIADKVKLTIGAQSQRDVVARLQATASISGEELVELAQQRGDAQAIAPLLERSLSLSLEVPGLPIARASQLAGQAPVAEGQLTGRMAFTGTAARPHLTGRLELKDLTKGARKLGAADLYVEADGSGANLHLGIDPPGGGNFLGHATLRADLGARTLLREGVASVLGGSLGGRIQARRLDLAFLSGLLPNLRRAGGLLDGDVSVSGALAKPTAQGDAHLRHGLFDVVGQGVYEDVGLDATFSPKEVVVDRLTGTTGTGTFAAILVASRKTTGDPQAPDRVEFTGEVHLGDGESVRDRKLPGGQPLRPGPVPLRQAGEQRADVNGELDVFGDYSDGLLTVNARIPDARVVIQQLPSKKLPSLKENPDILLVHPGERPHPPGREPDEVDAEIKARQNATFRMHAHLDLQHLYVRAADFEFPVESAMNFDYDARHPDQPSAEGTIHVPVGSFNALGRRFTISDAKITETGGDIADPELEIKARFENPQANVTITVTGSAQDPNLQLTSDPPMDQDAIAFFLATGRVQGRATQQGGGVDLSGAATSVLGGLLFGQVRKELQQVLPVDVLTIETGPQGVSEASVGKYIGDRVFIGYRQRLIPAPNENTSEGRIEYEISRSFSAEATVGDRNSDVSVLYTRDF